MSVELSDFEGDSIRQIMADATKEIESLRHQLAGHIKREVMLRDALQSIADNASETAPLVADRFVDRAQEIALEALAATEQK